MVGVLRHTARAFCTYGFFPGFRLGRSSRYAYTSEIHPACSTVREYWKTRTLRVAEIKTESVNSLEMKGGSISVVQ